MRDRSGSVLLERRPERGIWGGLYSLPELAEGESASDWCSARLGAAPLEERSLPPIAHAFTHFDLAIEPRLVLVAGAPGGIADVDHCVWHRPGNGAASVGLPAPIAALLAALDMRSEQHGSLQQAL